MFKNRSFIGLMFVVALVLYSSCSQKQQKPTIVLGGIYLTQNNDSLYRVSKVMAMSKSYIHVRFYSDLFKEKPTDVDSKKLHYPMSYIAMGKMDFLFYKPRLLKVEEVLQEEWDD